jgi:hypothetical protein
MYLPDKLIYSKSSPLERFQSIGLSWCDFKYSLVFEKCLHPKNAPLASGDG